jgi:DNA-binding protein HU-beta
MTKSDAGKAVDALFSTDGGVIAKALRKGSRVQITGFGTFETKHRKARTGRNPRTGQTIRIAATKTPGFRAGKGLKDAVK